MKPQAGHTTRHKLGRNYSLLVPERSAGSARSSHIAESGLPLRSDVPPAGSTASKLTGGTAAYLCIYLTVIAFTSARPPMV
jgi:hypothetical protein